MSRIAYIYVIQNKLNAKKYVGVTTDLRRRIEFHLSGFSDCGIAKAVGKYGRKNFTWYVICCSKDIEYAYNVLEPYFINKLRSYAPLGEGYNFTLGGEGAVGLVVSAESRQKISKSRLGSVIPENIRRKISESNIRTKKDPESRRKNSEARMGDKNPFFGKKHPAHIQQVIKTKLSAANIGSLNPAARSIIINNVSYATINEAACAMNMSYWQFYNWRRKNESKISN